MSQKPYQCAQCKSAEFTSHLRHVQVSVGWPLTRLEAIAPVLMCKTCGQVTVETSIEIGRYMGPTPGEPPPPRGGNVVDLPRPAPTEPETRQDPVVVASEHD